MFIGWRASCVSTRSRRFTVTKHHVPSLADRHRSRQIDCSSNSRSTGRIKVWVTDIAYIRSWQGWSYLAVVLDPFACKVVGCSMQETMARGLVLDALLMAVWRERPGKEVIVHSYQGSQYGSVSAGSIISCPV